MPSSAYALSIKQPWATLLAHGLKTIEVRSWSTKRRGPILLHAASIPDNRPEAWRRLPEELAEHARLLGGIIGAGNLIDCLPYQDRDSFTNHQDRHLNDPAWYDEPLYGFVFDELHLCDFRKCTGSMRFFTVEDDI